MEDEKNRIDKMDETDKAAMEALFSELDKGIDDMEAGRVFPVEDAFQMIEDMLNREINQE
jgi:predicted transcriptional regulator